MTWKTYIKIKTIMEYLSIFAFIIAETRRLYKTGIIRTQKLFLALKLMAWFYHSANLIEHIVRTVLCIKLAFVKISVITGIFIKAYNWVDQVNLNLCSLIKQYFMKLCIYIHIYIYYVYFVVLSLWNTQGKNWLASNVFNLSPCVC